MKVLRRTLLGLVIVLPSVIARNAQAEIISYGFTGSVSYISTELMPAFQFNEPIDGTISIDSAISDICPASLGLGFYPGAVTFLSFMVGGNSYQRTADGSGSFVEVFDNWTGDPGSYSYDIGASVNGPGANSYDSRLFQIGLLDRNTPHVINSVSQPGSNFNFADFTGGNFDLNFGNTDGGSNYEVDGVLSSFTVIPEPKTLTLLGTALVSLTYVRRRHLRTFVRR